MHCSLLYCAYSRNQKILHSISLILILIFNPPHNTQCWVCVTCVKPERIFHRSSIFVKGLRKFQNHANLCADFDFIALSYNWGFFMSLKRNVSNTKLFNKTMAVQSCPDLTDSDCTVCPKKYNCTWRVNIEFPTLILMIFFTDYVF